MTYVPILKNRQFEIKFIKENSFLFDQDIVPLIEVINLKLGRKTYLPSEIEQLVGEYNKIIKSLFFLDFFTFLDDDYDYYDKKQMLFSLRLRNEKHYKYLDLLFSSINYENCIPVISIKKARDFLFNETLLTNLITSLQKEKNKIAIRIEYNSFADLNEVITPLLRKDDYFMFDLKEEKIDACSLDLLELKSYDLKCHKIILNSPRLRKIQNGSYINGGYTHLIDNSIRTIYKKEGFDGFGDYAGLKDELPTDTGSGKGFALGLFFNYQKNQFYSIVNNDIKDKTNGHKYIIDKMFDEKTYLELNYDGSCLAYEYVKNELKDKNKAGIWGTWKYITILRYINQIKKSYQNK